jgi:hypothetical protein
MIDFIAAAIKTLFIFWIHMLWGTAVVFALAYLAFQFLVAIFS